MARRTLRLVVGVGVALAVAVLVVVGIAIWLVSTASGARLVLERVGEIMPGGLELGRVEGPLRGPLRIENLVYTRDGMRLEIDELVLRWDLRDLLRRLVDVHELTATGVRMTLAASDEESDSPFEPPQIDLPVNVVVRQASVRDATIVRAEGEPLEIRSIDLATSTRGDAVEIERFELDSPDLDLDVAGSLTPLGEYAVDLEVGWAFQAPEGALYRGSGTLDGTLEDLRVRQRLEEPVVADLAARLYAPLDDLRFEGGLEASDVRLQAVDPEWPAALVAADLAAEGSLEAFAVRGEVAVASDEYGRFVAELAASGGGESWTIERLRVVPARGDGTMLVDGELVLGDPPRFDLQVEWEDLRWPLGESAAEATALLPTGSVRVEGTAEDYRLDGRVRVGLPGLLAAETAGRATPRADGDLDRASLSGPADVAPDPARAEPDAAPGEVAGSGARQAPLWIEAELTATGDRSGARIERLAGTALGGSVTGAGRVSWQPEVDWDLELRLADVDPGLYDPRLEGQVDVTVRTEGTAGEAGPRGSVELAQLRGTVGGEPVRGAGRIELDGPEYRVPELNLEWGGARVEAAGVLGDRLDLRFDLEAPDLRRLLPELEGSLAVEGTVTGTREAPGLVATADGSGLELGDLAAGEVSGRIEVGSGPQDPLEIALEAEGVRYGELEFERALLAASGTRADHRLEATLAGGSPPVERVELAAAGGLVERVWSGSVTELLFAPEEEQAWTLASAAEVSVGPELIQLDGACLTSEGQRLCAAAAWRGAEDWSVEATATDVSLARLSRFYREDLDLRGSASARLDAEAAAGGIRGNAVVTSAEGSFVVPGDSELAGRQRFRDARLSAVAGASGTRAEAAIELVDVGPVEGYLQLAGWNELGMPPPEQPIEGGFVARVSSLEPLVLVSDAFARPRGRLDADLEIGGTVGEPILRGAAELSDASAFVVPLGIDVEDVNVSAAPDAGGDLVVAGSLRSGEGELSIRGTAPLEPDAALARLELSGEDVLVMDLPDRRVVASTDELAVEWTTERIAVEGDVRIPAASIELGGDDPDVVTPSPDVVFVRLPPGSERLPQDEIDLYARVRLLLGEEVHVSGFGLEAQVQGALLVIEEPGSLTRATGELDLAGGTFAAYGARLEIERGRLVFAESPITNPALDLRASRRARDVVAGIEAQGTLERPRVTLWSEPPMPQAEQLSYLVLGRPLGEAGSGEGDLLTRAANSLGLRGGRYLAGQLGSILDLEEARIETGEGGFETASLVLGKFLTPRLYVAYGVGLFEEGTNSLLLRYLLSDNLTLEALTGESTRADVLYVIETGPGEPRPRLEPELPDFDIDD